MRTNRKMFLIFTVVFLVCCLLTTSSWAAKRVKFLNANKADYIRMLNENNRPDAISIGPVLGLTENEDLKFVREITDFNRVTHKRFQQSLDGIPVWGIETIVSLDANGIVVNLNGDMVLDARNDVKSIPAKLDPLAALRKMQKNHKNQDLGAVWQFRNETKGTFIWVDAKDKAHLCYVVSYFADTECGNPSRPIFFIDVKTGKVIHSFDSLAYAYDGTGPGGNQKIGQYTYGSTYPKFGVAINGSTCTMNYADCKTVDLNHGTSGTTPFSYTCYNNTHESINGGYCPMNDAQYFGQQIYNMYQAWYSLPVLPFQLMMRCHYSNNYENAFWDGSSMTFGDGYSTFYPLVCLDVSAHEVSHGFTENHSNLTYSSQSGGINESYSDMAGEAAKYYMRGTNDFKVGYDIFKSPTGALRYMYDPPLDGNSIDHVSEYYEGLDVHYSSGIFNKAFYLIATSSGWTTRMAFDIFTKANTTYWTASTNFQQGAEGAKQAAIDYGYNCTAVKDAFAVVGITLTCPVAPVANFSGTPTSGGAPLTVNFTDLSTNSPTAWSWTFGDGGTSTVKNPSHTYTSPGTYTVSLTATNASGSDNETKTNYINVLAPQPPVAAFTGTPTTVTVGQNVTFTDQSTNTPTSWSWTFEGGTPGTSTSQNPVVTYNTVGTYDVTLVATNAQGSDSEAKVDYITVNTAPADEIAEAVDYPSLTFTKSGNANWYKVTDVYYYGNDSARSGAIGNSQSTTIQTSITVASTQAVKFYWKVSSESGYDYLKFYIDGVEKTKISGTVNWTQVSYNVAAGTHTLKWSYIKDAYVVSGSDCGWVDKLEITAPPADPIAEAVDYLGLSFVLSGNANWFSQTTTTYYGGDAAQSGDIGNNQTSTMETTISGKTSVKFYWRVSSETNYDYLRFYIDGVEQAKISGSTSWAQKTYTVTSGSHTLKWSFTKDAYVSSGSDCGWVDLLELQ
jgi:vibriolysin